VFGHFCISIFFHMRKMKLNMGILRLSPVYMGMYACVREYVLDCCILRLSPVYMGMYVCVREYVLVYCL
jgi:hypothetical protein